MQLDEFIQATNRLETYYGKELSTDQMQIMYEELKNLSIDRYIKLISKCLKTCKYLPKIADIVSANMEMIGEVSEEEKRQIVPCKKCDGTGYVAYSKFIMNGNERIPYTFFARCNCENAKYANQKIPSYEELGIKISNRLNQIKDTNRSIEKIKKEIANNFSFTKKEG